MGNRIAVVMARGGWEGAGKVWRSRGDGLDGNRAQIGFLCLQDDIKLVSLFLCEFLLQSVRISF